MATIQAATCIRDHASKKIKFKYINMYKLALGVLAIVALGSSAIILLNIERKRNIHPPAVVQVQIPERNVPWAKGDIDMWG
jgi:hypothetical protein